MLKRRLFEFGPYRLDPVARVLFREQTLVAATPKALDILTILVQCHGQPVSKDDLVSKVWPDTHVEEGNLTQQISVLRKALGPDEDGQTYIETIPKRGYRFAAPVREVDADSPLVERIARPTPRFSRRWVTLTLALVASSALATVLYVNGSHTPEIHSLAILPLASATNGQQQEYFADSLTDALTAEMGRITNLRVISHSSVRQYEAKRKPLNQIQQELKVDAVVQGSVLRVGDRVRATMRLTDASRDRQLWSRAYEAKTSDLPALQVRVVRDLAHRIGADSALPRPAESQSVGPAAYDLYLRGVFLAGRGNETDNLAAVELLEKAVAAAPAFAPGHAQLARAYVLRFNTYAPDEQKLWESKAYAAIQRALTLDPQSPEAYYARGMFQWSVASQFHHDDAAKDQLRAIALRPSFALAHRQLANVYLHVGLLDEALTHARQAALIDPAAAAPRFSIASALSFGGRYEEALPAWLEVREFLPSFSTGHLAWVLFQLGRKKEARARAEEAMEKNPDDNGGILSSVQALLAADAGQPGLAEAKIRRALRAKHTELYHHATYFVASAYAKMHRANEALRWLQYTAEDGFPCYPLFQHDPNLNALRGDPRFVSLLDGMKREWDRRRSLFATLD